MSTPQPGPRPDRVPVGPNAYAPPQGPEFSVGYRRWAGVLIGLAITIAVLVVAAFVASIVLLVQADADVENAAYGYLAIFLWFGIAAAIPVLLAVAVPGVIMMRRVRRQRSAAVIP